MRRTRLFIFVFAIAVLAIYFLYIIVPISKGYEYFTAFAADLINKKQRLQAIRASFPESRFTLIQTIVYAGGSLIAIVSAFTFYYSNSIYNFYIRARNRIEISYRSTIDTFWKVDVKSKLVFGLAIIYIIAQSLWYMYHLPFIHDEAYTISNFVLPGPVAATTFYPYPNNHILFSLFSYPFSFLPIKPEIAFRLPSLIAVVLTCFVLFKLLMLTLKPLQAALGVVVFVLMLPVMTYAVFSRGYCLVFLFTALSLYSLVQIINSNSTYHQILLIVFSVLGLYTVPSYMYPFAAIYAVYFGFGFIHYKALVKQSIISGLVTAITVLMLYLPVIITSGGWSNFVKVIYFGYDDTSSITKVRYFIDSVYALQFFESFGLAIFFLVVTVVLAIASIKKVKSGGVGLPGKILLYAGLLGFLIPLISFVVQRKMVAPRTHTYAALFFVVFIFITINIVVNEKFKRFAIGALTLIIITLNIALAHGSNILTGEAYHDKSADLFATEMLRDKPANDTCYTFSLFYLANLQLKYALTKRTITVYQSPAGSPSTAVFDFSKTYNWVITSEDEASISKDSLQRKYEAVIERKDAILWRKRKVE